MGNVQGPQSGEVANGNIILGARSPKQLANARQQQMAYKVGRRQLDSGPLLYWVPSAEVVDGSITCGLSGLPKHRSQIATQPLPRSSKLGVCKWLHNPCHIGVPNVGRRRMAT